jgi:hypothetical protein
MADNQDNLTGAGGSTGGDSTPDPAAVLAAQVEALPRLRLAHFATKFVAVPDSDKVVPRLREPVTVQGVANIPGVPPVFFPDAETQAKGFAPMFAARLGGRVTNRRFEPAGGGRFNYVFATTAEGVAVELDVSSAAEARRAVLTQFAGIYKPVEGKETPADA